MEFKERRKFKSKWEEYHHGEWRKGSGKTFVTLETVIPPMPENLIKAPQEAEFQKKEVEIKDKISEINKALDTKKSEFEEILQQKNA